MGSEFKAAEEPEALTERKIELYVCGAEDIQCVEIICNNRAVHTVSPKGQRKVHFVWRDTRDFAEIAIGPAKWCSRPFVFYYARVRQADGEMAWSSPVWMD